MAIRHGVASSSVALVPTITIDPVTNFNQSIATLNATVNPNGYTTSVYFEYKESTTSTWTNGGTVSGITGGSQSVYVNVTGLLGNNLHDVRATATNQIGSSVSGTTTFTTWALQSYERTTSGGVTFTIPTVTPTGGSPVAVSIYDIIMFGGGGGSSDSGGGGSGYVSLASASLSGNRTITTSVGGAGANGSGSAGTSGSSSTITGDISTLTATGGNGSNGTAGASSGNGNSGGSNASYDYTPGDKFGFVNNAYGGGGGATGLGGTATANSSGTYGGGGGSGITISRGGVTVSGGAGGGGGAAALDGGPSGAGSVGSSYGYGTGGTGAVYLGSAAVDPTGGYIRFRYYAASALA